ncbi:hypothetical protein EGR_07996 [Echinococcus granulosus]|uniref:FERM N-terminal domain-containing protein n=1 Tax=Echinococcus granulosus TaxID=6210 RepID=W6UG50_ECHGR|nr:hypothetical protein EGR_07996 [Echinococcus granulosus]EUB57112.1 hypothetical protein EGR_07996 [Echinococcus granulosus]
MFSLIYLMVNRPCWFMVDENDMTTSWSKMEVRKEYIALSKLRKLSKLACKNWTQLPLIQMDFIVGFQFYLDSVTLKGEAAVFGQWLFDEVINQLGGLLESDYFGLRYLDKNKQRVDPSFLLYDHLNARFKYFPENFAKIMGKVHQLNWKFILLCLVIMGFAASHRDNLLCLESNYYNPVTVVLLLPLSNASSPEKNANIDHNSLLEVHLAVVLVFVTRLHIEKKSST